MANQMTAMRDGYADYMTAACAEPYDHEVYRWCDARVRWLVGQTYDEVLFELVMDWLADCGEVPSLDDARSRWWGERMDDLNRAAIDAAHATDMVYGGGATNESKDEVADKFKRMVELVDLMVRANPQASRENLFVLAMVHGMREKAADYGVELR